MSVLTLEDVFQETYGGGKTGDWLTRFTSDFSALSDAVWDFLASDGSSDPAAYGGYYDQLSDAVDAPRRRHEIHAEPGALRVFPRRGYRRCVEQAFARLGTRRTGW